MSLSLLVRLGKTKRRKWNWSNSQPYVTSKQKQTKDFSENLTRFALHTAVRHIKDGHNICRMFLDVLKENCRFQLATALLNSYPTALSLTAFNSSLRKGLNKTTGRQPARKDSVNVR
jgi:hypothetical protein